MRALTLSALVYVLFLTTPLSAQQLRPTASAEARPKAELRLENPEIIEVEVTIARWNPPASEPFPTPEQRKLAGPTKEVAEKLAALQKEGHLTSVHRILLSTLDQQSASVQIGADQPRITGRQSSPRGGSTNSITYSSVGTLVQITPRALQEERIAVELEVSKSGLNASADAPTLGDDASGNPTRLDTMRTLTLRTTTVVVDGHTSIVSGSLDPNEGELVLLSVRKQSFKSAE